jgi:tungstate transport system substrate-binding protein
MRSTRDLRARRPRSIASRPLGSFAWLTLFALLAGGAETRAQERLRMATTTSVQDSGLMEYLLPHFEKTCRCKVDVIAVGTGQALKLAANGDVDLLVAHDPQGEKRFVDEGFGIGRRTFMVNDFIVVGPRSDPARIRGLKNAAQALAAIAKAGAPFISRGDESGTHVKEKTLWKAAGARPAGRWYFEIGQGMGAVLTMAQEKQAYALCDRATYLARRIALRLDILVEGDPELLNFYSVIQVNPARFPAVKAELAGRLSGWFCTSEGQKLIGDYAVGGNRLFRPACMAGK